MTSWFNSIAANRIIHRNKLPKWFYRAPKIFNNNGNHGHDVWLYYFITALGLCFCRAVTNRTWCVVIEAQHAVWLVHSWPTRTNGSSQKQTESLSSPFTCSIFKYPVWSWSCVRGWTSRPPECLLPHMLMNLLLLKFFNTQTAKVPNITCNQRVIEYFRTEDITFSCSWQNVDC